MRVALSERRRAGACQLTCCPRGACQPCQRARPRSADATAPSTERRMSNRQRRRALAGAGVWVRLSRSWLGCLVKAAMRAASEGPMAVDESRRSIDTAGLQPSTCRRSNRCASRPTNRIRRKTADLAITACGDRAFLDPSLLRRAAPSACYRQSRPAKWHIRGFALARRLKAVDGRRRRTLER
jgi:hypothetical protein